MNKPKIVILTDLWGKKNTDWIRNYIEILEPHLEIVVLDSCDLGEIDVGADSEKVRHEQFVNGGLERAAQNLLQIEIQPLTVLAFSIGGTIAWRAALSGFAVQYLFAISSTRLRLETQKPDCKVQLFYGTEDQDKPKDKWFDQMGLNQNFYENESHEFYKSKETALAVCALIIGAIV